MIYRITNIINGKIYIGKTIRSLNVRWYAHKYDTSKSLKDFALYRAMRKYGIENFKIEKMCDGFSSNSDLNYAEKYLIRYYNSNNPDVGYNCTDGGDGGPIMYGENNPSYGKKNITLYNYNKSRKGIPLSEETREKISQSLINNGFTHSDESKNKMSKSTTLCWKKGIYDSKEYREKLGAAKRGKTPFYLTKSVRCIETGITYKSLADASEDIAGNRLCGSNISNQIKGKAKKAYGFTYEYINLQ